MTGQPRRAHQFVRHELSAVCERQVLLLAPGSPHPVPGLSEPSRRAARRRRPGFKKRVIGQVVVFGVAGPLSDVAEDLDREMQLALADEPRAVVCDLSAMLGGVEPLAVQVLAMTGRHVRNWPGIPVAVVCPDPQVRRALRTHPLGRHLLVTDSLFCALSAVLASRALTAERLRLAPHPTAPRAARNFVTRTLLDWHLDRFIPPASLVVSELVASSSINSGTDIDLSIVWNLGALRLTVRDKGPGLPGQRHSSADLHGRRPSVVAGFSCAFGVLPTTFGGKVAWAVLHPSRRQTATSHHPPAIERQEALIHNDARARAQRYARGIVEMGHS